MTAIACKKSVNLMSPLWCDRRRDLRVCNEVVSIITDGKLVRERDLPLPCGPRLSCLTVPHRRKRSASRKLRIRAERGRTCVASSMRRRAASGQSSGPSRSMACGMSRPTVSFNEGQLSNCQTNQIWRTPKMIDRRALISVGLAIGLVSWGAPGRAEVAEVHLVRQFGIGYLPLTIMLHESSSRSMRPKPVCRRSRPNGRCSAMPCRSTMG
jgi:hypothetical protein